MPKQSKPPRIVRVATGKELSALEAKESALKKADKANGTNTYGQFRAEEDAAFRKSLATDRRNGYHV